MSNDVCGDIQTFSLTSQIHNLKSEHKIHVFKIYVFCVFIMFVLFLQKQMQCQLMVYSHLSILLKNELIFGHIVLVT